MSFYYFCLGPGVKQGTIRISKAEYDRFWKWGLMGIVTDVNDVKWDVNGFFGKNGHKRGDLGVCASVCAARRSAMHPYFNSTVTNALDYYGGYSQTWEPYDLEIVEVFGEGV